MELKTKVHAEEGKQEIFIEREFDIPLKLLFKAYEDPEIVAQWMNTKVLKLENCQHGSWHFETTDPKGNKHAFHGVIHEFKPDKSIIRTFEMENASLGVQLEFLEFESLGDDRSKLNIHTIYRSVSVRDQLLQLPFKQGINMAHNQLENIMKRLKQ